MRASTFALLFKQDNLLPALTLGENLDLPAKLNGTRVSTQERTEIIDLFGYKSGRVTDKFAGRAAETDSNGNPYLKEHMVSRIACKVVDQMEIGSFLLFVGQATEAEVLGDGRVLTLQAYTDRGKATPPTATVYRTVEINGYRCTVCGYVYEGESLPPDFRCPLCHAPAEKFVKIEK